jgi:hypothetical protein
MDEEEIAESQDGTERLAIDDFRFESFPAIWPATEEKLKTIQDVLLSADQIQELRRFKSWTGARNQRSSSSNWTLNLGTLISTCNYLHRLKQTVQHGQYFTNSLVENYPRTLLRNE